MAIVIQALHELLSLHHFLYLMGGILVGMIVGVLPGMGGTAGMALLLPFVYGMEKESALALMIGMLATTATGDTFPSILMGIPGGSSSATVLDGFQLARKGHAARALSAAFSASMLGGLFGSVVLVGCVFIARPLILAIGMGEQLLLLVLALTMVGCLTGASPIKGLASCGLGLLIGTVGSAPATGELRFAFDTVYLSDGIPLIVLALGIFAMPEIVDLMRQRSTIADTPTLGSGWREGVEDTFRNWWLVLRVSVIGAIVGVLPGVGASTADWLAYGHVVQSSRQRDQFGKGDIRGVIAPEAANHAVRGGDLVPTLFFGIPGSGSMALLLGGFILIGIEPGARMVTQNLDLTFLIIWSLAIASIIGALLCIILAGPIAKLTLVKYSYLAPFITVLMFFTAYQATRDWGDVVALFALTIVGLLLKRFGWSRPALIVGFVLSSGLEASIYQTVQVYGFTFLARPQSIIILILVIASLVLALRAMRSRASADGTAREFTASRLPQILFSTVMAIAVACAIVSVSQDSYLTLVFPLGVGGLTLILLLIVIAQQSFGSAAHPALADENAYGPDEEKPIASQLLYMSWFFGFICLMWLVGFSIASAIFVGAFITAECRGPIWRNAGFGAATTGVLSILAFFLYLQYPAGVLEQYVSLPWWLR
ncbi:tripartite tricarboxylate transporter permease [Starkeya sp. ORNL1]|uniref:tripartite tricarboxylate transporter permease n=1 Tax=Starkeya sp. ORNL1 TaxID=2709380 RepID=UPI001464386B|nr:tripartite tricarboxylate transporter permease [Starkeya sp. ORNL1]QJP12320.1 tripartite tricarboxylate transporter permease [Starkeya sp. ORNL1]